MDKLILSILFAYIAIESAFSCNILWVKILLIITCGLSAILNFIGFLIDEDM